MTTITSAPPIGRNAAWAIALLLVGYVAACSLGWPQRGTELVVNSQYQLEAHGEKPTPPHYIWVAPFVLLLGCIAILPLVPATRHWWESNLHRFYIAAGLGAITLLYYLVGHRGPVHGDWPAPHVVPQLADGGLHWHGAATVFANAILSEYVPFIVLLFSLFTISGGIRIEGDLKAHPLTNTAFLAVGALLASLIGTTGAAMLLIRPLLETNSERKRVAHTVIFFIFIVCNCGGCLLPIGDPPLFLGYLQGVDFFWTLQLWKEWLFVNASLLAIYFLWDHFFHYPRETKADIALDETQLRRLTFAGMGINGPLLLLVVACVALLDPAKVVPGTQWHPWLYLREMCLLGLIVVSLLFGPAAVRGKNRFTFGAIIEVAALFFGIFLCMQPALEILHVMGPHLPLTSSARYFWATGVLSSVLDNAPTYMVFFETAKTMGGPHDLPVNGGTIQPLILQAISLGAVFMGANTYIGNGPNFMVKALAEEAGVQMPTFFGYMKYSLCVLIPLFVLTTWLFF
ncbi:MAG: sodium:proton antiporter [Planctomycetia bacterium]|nr:sodium:proton antiporter [Planctomycetia bacterium]